MTMFSMALADPMTEIPSMRRYSLVITIGLACGVTAAEICDAIKKAANTAGTLTSLRN